jgi:RNA binding exosome subunit
MKKKLLFIILAGFLFVPVSHAGLMDKAKALKEKVTAPRGEPDTNTTIAGLKEALSVGTENAVKSVSQADGYFGNPAIKIPLPENVQKVAKTLRKVGLKKEVDSFEVSMNRAAEKAAPRAKDIFIGAVKEMTFQDAKKVLFGGDTAATDYLKAKTSEKIYTAFKPIVSSTMNDVGVTKSYKQLADKAKRTHLLKEESLDLDRHVTNKALDGLFYMVGQEEKKIRTDPLARVTELLKKVFGR